MKRCAFVTGAAQGMGEAIVIRLAQEGYNICLVDINIQKAKNVETKCASFGVKTMVAEVDVSSYVQVEHAVKTCHEALGGPDIVVNNAGIMGKYAFVYETTDNDFESIFNINVKSAINTFRAIVPYMKEKGFGRFINCSSMYGITPEVGRGIYSASKTAIISLSKVLAAEVAQFGITVNAYAPGAIMTEMSKDSLERGIEEKLQNVPIKRFGRADEVAGLVAFLASSESSYMTGAVYQIDGGCNAVLTASRALRKLKEYKEE